MISETGVKTACASVLVRLQDCRDEPKGSGLGPLGRHPQNGTFPGRTSGWTEPVNCTVREVIVSLQGAPWNRKPETKYEKTNPVCFSRHGNAALTLWLERHRQHNRRQWTGLATRSHCQRHARGDPHLRRQWSHYLDH